MEKETSGGIDNDAQFDARERSLLIAFDLEKSKSRQQMPYQAHDQGDILAIVRSHNAEYHNIPLNVLLNFVGEVGALSDDLRVHYWKYQTPGMAEKASLRPEMTANYIGALREVARRVHTLNRP